jgi:hypothetical protein
MADDPTRQGPRPAERRAPREILRVLVFAAAAALGIYLFFGEFLPAHRERRAMVELLRRVESENASLREERVRLKLRADALRGDDPRAIEQGLRRHGFVPEGRIRIESGGPGPGSRPEDEVLFQDHR